ncbi:hypothetical protein OG601_24075 [Streptomyces sp. NBC_01239]|uniref:hypothetical protein n=1 Tax=Streptomyces sp. NBC_01239 TaxID=2903792 RepID=UPI002252E68F|nr:hypothetical protein [Streptomyces sp. NBC_01239]MCX4813680.1 hypothetical protein [Streptomyces sp. NBC_01239]
MAADWWARGIGLGAGTLALCNTVIQFYSYRRGKPLISITIQKIELGNPRDGRTRGVDMFSVRLVNGGNVSIDVEALWFSVKTRKQDPQDVTAKVGFSRRTVDGHSGKTLTWGLPISTLPESGATVTHVRVVARLSTGKCVRSRKVRRKEIPGLA